MPEAKVAEAISDLLKSQNPTVATYTGLGEVRVRIAATGQNQDESRSLIDQMGREIRRRLKTHVYGGGDETLEEVVGRIPYEKRVDVGGSRVYNWRVDMPQNY